MVWCTTAMRHGCCVASSAPFANVYSVWPYSPCLFARARCSWRDGVVGFSQPAVRTREECSAWRTPTSACAVVCSAAMVVLMWHSTQEESRKIYSKQTAGKNKTKNRKHEHHLVQCFNQNRQQCSLCCSPLQCRQTQLCSLLPFGSSFESYMISLFNCFTL